MEYVDCLKLCKKIAAKYKSQTNYDDLVSEGILKCIELKETGETNHKRYSQVANRAMHDYLNIKLRQVNIPISSLTRKLSKGGVFKESHREGTVSSLMMIFSDNLTNDFATLEDDTDTEKEYEHEDMIQKVHSLLDDGPLDNEDAYVIKEHYLKGRKISDLCQELNLSDSTVRRRIQSGLDALKVTLCNNL